MPQFPAVVVWAASLWRRVISSLPATVLLAALLITSMVLLDFFQYGLRMRFYRYYGAILQRCGNELLAAACREKYDQLVMERSWDRF